MFNRKSVNTGLSLLSELCRANSQVSGALKAHSRSKQARFQGKEKVNVMADSELAV